MNEAWKNIIIIAVLAFSVLYPVHLSYNNHRLRVAKDYVKRYYGQEPKKDPWGTYYRVVKTNEEGKLTVIITSAGPDRELDTKDDIRGGYRKSVEVYP
jgi:hypothetical protein